MLWGDYTNLRYLPRCAVNKLQHKASPGSPKSSPHKSRMSIFFDQAGFSQATATEVNEVNDRDDLLGAGSRTSIKCISNIGTDDFQTFAGIYASELPMLNASLSAVVK
jgi:hypothetical protein